MRVMRAPRLYISKIGPALILGGYIMILTDRLGGKLGGRGYLVPSRQHPKAYQPQLHIRALPNLHNLVHYSITPDVIVI